MRLANLSLQGKVALVTGGGQGIGRASCLAFGAAGATVCVADLDPAAAEAVAAELRAAGADASAVRVDVNSEPEIAAMVGAALERHRRVDVLMNNAGGASSPAFRIGRIDQITARDWDATFSVNVRSAFLCTRAVVGPMRERGGGSVINMGSVTGLFPFPGMPAYSAAKAAVISLTKSLAMELAPTIRVNALAPGLIETPRTSLNRRPEQLDQLLSNVPLGRMGTPDEVADVALYLASDASAYISGTVIEVAGAQTWMAENGRPAFRDRGAAAGGGSSAGGAKR
ncbi:MAG: SDR family NAD(P)-dependent oxidoreductase [Lautropia sp.]